eukprot:31561-Eustigmatos_ZCMA.PRE.1
MELHQQRYATHDMSLHRLNDGGWVLRDVVPNLLLCPCVLACGAARGSDQWLASYSVYAECVVGVSAIFDCYCTSAGMTAPCPAEQ